MHNEKTKKIKYISIEFPPKNGIFKKEDIKEDIKVKENRNEINIK